MKNHFRYNNLLDHYWLVQKDTYIENLYFESTAIVIYFIKLGRYIDGISKDKTKEAIQKLVKITPNNATIKKDGIEKVFEKAYVFTNEIAIEDF